VKKEENEENSGDIDGNANHQLFQSQKPWTKFISGFNSKR